MKSFACKDVGLDCNWKTTGQTEEEILAKADEHAKKDHGMKEVSDELKSKARSVIKDVDERSKTQVA